MTGKYLAFMRLVHCRASSRKACSTVMAWCSRPRSPHSAKYSLPCGKCCLPLREHSGLHSSNMTDSLKNTSQPKHVRHSQLHVKRLLHARSPIGQVLFSSLTVSHFMQSLSYVVSCAGKESSLHLQNAAMNSILHQDNMPDVAGDLPSQADEIDMSSPITQGRVPEPQSASKQPTAQVRTSQAVRNNCIPWCMEISPVLPQQQCLFNAELLMSGCTSPVQDCSSIIV